MRSYLIHCESILWVLETLVVKLIFLKGLRCCETVAVLLQCLQIQSLYPKPQIRVGSSDLYRKKGKINAWHRHLSHSIGNFLARVCFWFLNTVLLKFWDCFFLLFSLFFFSPQFSTLKTLQVLVPTFCIPLLLHPVVELWDQSLNLLLAVV